MDDRRGEAPWLPDLCRLCRLRRLATLHLRGRNPAPALDASGDSPHRGAGHAQRNIAHRLAWRFGPQARVTTGWADGYYACEVTLPLA